MSAAHHPYSRRSAGWPLVAAVCLLVTPGVRATGVLRNFAGGEAAALGGAMVAGADSPLAAMWANPAVLATIDAPAFEAGYFGAYGDATFANSVNGEVGLRRHAGHGGEFALVCPLGGGRGTAALAVIPEATLLGDWRYRDAPGGTDGSVTYGLQRHRSRFLAIRTAMGIGWNISDDLAVGASVGLVYDRIDLQVPYIFQTAPGLEDFKTLLDLETDGWSWNGELGVRLRLRDDLHLGLRYRTSTSLHSDGRAAGDASAQLAALGSPPPRTDFHYGADVSLSLPDIVSAGLAWQATGSLTVLGQVDWIPWGDHFDAMRVALGDGDNPDLPSSIVDSVPLGWEDRFTIRAGLQCDLNPRWTWRCGYIHSASPIPARHVTPLNAAIAEHSLTTGVGLRLDDWTLDAGYQLDLRHRESVGTSAYRAGEYSRSEVSYLAHWWGVSATRRF
ncbi:MAG: hypothetical protein HKN82_06355 [Akkermansiaceae bacterium]|nr:hypothetical protein [Akkermansiaceae bacterium]NNM31040.1 hypothetical protein [Akkermansiaceae bacterium]